MNLDKLEHELRYSVHVRLGDNLYGRLGGGAFNGHMLIPLKPNGCWGWSEQSEQVNQQVHVRLLEVIRDQVLAPLKRCMWEDWR